jgi:hypothetical protein
MLLAANNNNQINGALEEEHYLLCQLTMASKGDDNGPHSGD